MRGLRNTTRQIIILSVKMSNNYTLKLNYIAMYSIFSHIGPYDDKKFAKVVSCICLILIFVVMLILIV